MKSPIQYNSAEDVLAAIKPAQMALFIAIAEQRGLSLEWLLTGKGEPFMAIQPSQPARLH